ncbi:MAG: hypothetical protein A3E98_01315 [Candidatus Doudnabacteria bacterium RIFCSPHIGHO2_12_FULL_48_11]|uniref:Uncharacterized protein n=1 Tax=Candidatus Doudnabacteria bacterium RIFCSPHIGHO2_01_FULL_46_24 TaxID=1817825 RepID=A0A1F5NWC4_9BACT|nr:MAG: hypothetical protein A2720_03570 [Candidatus Doudnabacteria bacterium RIFCSPHIGHO2_01_FULL_46_24]OGE95620.1 MAG: hypothetical protein A3E98_01315 [Candidatus Doudnabacteria bacterium RIFCSPHIGHO2_12_FULL_48_11]
MKQKILWLVLGAIIALGAQWSITKYIKYQEQKKFVAFLQDFEKTSDKSGAINNYLSTKKGLTLELSTTHADSKERECRRIRANIRGLEQMEADAFAAAQAELGEGVKLVAMEAFESQIESEINTQEERWSGAGCEDLE